MASRPSNINLDASKSTLHAAGTVTPSQGKTPTQETHRFHAAAANPDQSSATSTSSLSKRRGSDSLSIGITSNDSAPSGSENPVLPRTRPNLNALASVNAANAAGKDLSTPRPDDTLDTPNALGLKRPPPRPTQMDKSTAVADDDDEDDNNDDSRSNTSAGDQGDDEGDRAAAAAMRGNGSNSNSGTATPQSTYAHHQHQHQQHQSQHPHHAPHQQHHPRSYMDIPAHERGRTGNGHDLELSGTQPMRPRQHQRTSTASSIASSSRREREHMRPFPTPGMKTPNGHHSQHGPQNGHSAEKDPFDEIKSVEECRLMEAEEKKRHWKRWGPYLSERQWATVREDYSANGDAWTHFPHEHARSRAYRWGEDGLGGVSDNHQRLCFGLALWNGKDPILKERLFGVTGHQGNHGEDVKELYYYLDSTPTHSYMKYLYKYPQRRFPYEKLVEESTQRSRDVVEYEITDTDAFEEDRYWDIFVEYAKDEDNENGMSVRITAYNRGPEPADLHIIPQLWFRNTWSWPKVRPTGKDMPNMKAASESTVQIDHPTLGRYYCHMNESPGPIEPIKRGQRGSGPIQPIIVDESVAPELMFTNNDTNFQRLYGGQNVVPFVKDAFHDYIIPGHRPPVEKKEAEEKPAVHVADSGTEDPNHVRPDDDATPPASIPSTPGPTTKFTEPSLPKPEWPNFINPDKEGTKFGAHYTFSQVPPNGGCCVVRLKLTDKDENEDEACLDEELFDDTIQERKTDADEFYARFNSGSISDDLRNIMRQALSGMLWTKQYYYFVQKEWIEGDPGQPAPPPERQWIRNRDWKHLHCEDILSMPDKWEYPFFAAWDTAFHCIPLAMVDPAYAKNQLMLMVREWYMKPDGALPAYEWNYSDVNPPVHAWATFRVFKIERKMYGREDIGFLERVFQKLLMNFTWWVNRKDAGGNNVFEGGFLGLDNIGIFNRSEPLPTGGVLRQADGTAWMAFYCLNMLNMALELAKHNPSYEDIASKFFEHFLFISDAMTFKSGGSDDVSLWNEEDGFYYDAISWGHNHFQQLPVRSLVGLIPTYATLTLEPSAIKKFPGFKKRMDWFIQNRPEISGRNVASMHARGKSDRKLLALCSEDRLRKLLERMLDETEFLSDYGIRSLSRAHKEKPYSMDVNGQTFSVEYWPGDSHSGMFGGNSNWRGPIWLAVNFLLIESLQRFHQFYGHDFKIECPTGSGDFMTLANVADEIQHRIIHIFARDHEGRRAYNGGSEKLNKDPHFRDHLQFHEFFHADNGRGLGASHQTGWTGLVAWFIWQSGHSARMPRTPRTPRTTAMHYFDEIVPSTPGGSEYDTDYQTDALSASELSPDEL